MPIRVTCSSCDCAFQVADAAAGKRGKCPKCQTVLTIPLPPTPVAEEAIDLVPLDDDEVPYQLAGQAHRPVMMTAKSSANGKTGPKGQTPVVLGDEDLVTTATLTPAQILAAFQDYIEPVKPTPLYRFWIVVVACFMFLLPLVYLALIGLVAYGVFWHVTNNFSVFDPGPNNFGRHRDGRGAVILYIVPIIAGLGLIAFMIKPLFARSGQGRKTRSLEPSKEPLLFAFVDGVCSTVGARTPIRIDVDCQVNASASFDGGPFSFMNRNLVLTIGLPLVGGLSIKQFAGVLAHEFGHFSQGAGMRLSTMIRSINFWFARVVYERDAWDENLAAWSRGGDVRVTAVVWVIRGVVWLTRRMLWVLMMAGHIVSGFLLRQMEFDADRYEARMVGGEVFESTARRLHVLGVANQGAFIDLQESWREGRLADNLPKLITANVAQIPAEALEKIDEQVTTGKTGLFDTHPTDKDRIFRAHAEDTDGVFTLEGPGTDVFRDFDSLCRAATFEYYKAIFGKNGVDKDSLRPVGDVVRTQTAAMQGNKALERFYQGVFDPFRPFLLPEVTPRIPADAKAARQALISARQKMAATIETYEESLKTYNDLRGEGIKVAAATAMLKADFKPKASDFGLTKANLDCASTAASEIAREIERLDEALSIRESATIRRIHGALSLLESDDIAEIVPDGPTWREEAATLYPVAKHVGRTVIPSLVETLKAHQALLGVLSKWQGNEQNAKMHNAIRRAGKVLHDQLQELSWKLGNAVAYPFDHAEGMISLAQYALPKMPGADDINELLDAAGNALDKMVPLHYRLVGRLMLAAEEVEKALGMEPLPERPKPDDEAAQAT
ncbi:MAG: Zn-dependent protease with chaperone function [Planctomycetota bacterium]|nr:Zn-dependent protease with chaperone function [Planctomycetota bacterium]